MVWYGAEREHKKGSIVCGVVCLARAAHNRLRQPSSRHQFGTPVTRSKEKLLQLYASSASLQERKDRTNTRPTQQEEGASLLLLHIRDLDGVRVGARVAMKAELERVDFGGELPKYHHQHGSALFPGGSGSSSQQKQGLSLFDFNPHKGALGLNLQVSGSFPAAAAAYLNMPCQAGSAVRFSSMHAGVYS